ncbi:MAG: septal ring lytic transglycosylase RlpA family protein [Pseudomonadota bacterium]
MKRWTNLAASGFRGAALAAGALGLAACATGGPSGGRTVAPHHKIGAPYKIDGRTYRPQADPNYDEVGMASWYGARFHGRPTANGERFDRNLLTAAHKTLPLPTMVEVHNLENGRSLVVRVNDRGPFVDDRIIDLSEAAARQLGFREKGLARVRVKYLREASLPMNARRIARRAPQDQRRVARRNAVATTSPSLTADLETLLVFTSQTRPKAYAAAQTWIDVGAYETFDAVERAHAALTEVFGDAAPDFAILPRGDGGYAFRIGPFDQSDGAQDALSRVRAAGHQAALVIEPVSERVLASTPDVSQAGR